MIGKWLNNKWLLNMKVSFDSYGGVLESPGRIDSVRDKQTNELKPFQENTLLEFNSKYINISLSADWYFHSLLYLNGGLNIALNVSDDITLKNSIVIPPDFTYEKNGEQVIVIPDSPTKMGSLSGLRVGVYAGFGLNYPISPRLSAFTETAYTYHFGSIISDGDWGLSQLTLLIGMRYRFKLEDIYQ